MTKNNGSQLLTLSLGSTVLLAMFCPSAIANSNAGSLEFEDSPTINQTTLVQDWFDHETVYQSSKDAKCTISVEVSKDYSLPGALVVSKSIKPYKRGQASTKAFFRSATTPAAAGLRVIIRNTSITGGKTSYSNRDYSNGSKSEAFSISPGTVHHSKYMAVQNGENRMTYEIRRNEEVVESGEFMINVTIENHYLTRTLLALPIPCKDEKPYGQYNLQYHA